MKTAISFCNQAGYLDVPNLLVLDIGSGEAIWPKIEIDNHGYTGLTQDHSYLYAVHLRPKGTKGYDGLVVIDKSSMAVTWNTVLDGVKDPHSIVIDSDQNLFVVSTGTEQILHFKVDHDLKDAIFMKSIWNPYSTVDFIRAEIKRFQMEGVWNSSKQLLRRWQRGNRWNPRLAREILGTHHINAIYLSDGKLLISAFGCHEERKLKSSARNGYIFNITDDVMVTGNIYHPHSLIWKDGGYYFCESATRKVMKGESTLVEIDAGYTRGLAINDTYLIVGSSSARKRSKSTGIVHNIADNGDLELVCNISVFANGDGVHERPLLKKVDFLPTHKEIYDILILDEGPPTA